MDLKTYTHEALKTWQDQPTEDKIKNAMMGLMGEVGEYIDLNKKRLYHKKDVGRDAAIKELGDICYYWSVLCHDLGIDAKKISRRELHRIKTTMGIIVALHGSVNRVVATLHDENYRPGRIKTIIETRMGVLWSVIRQIADMHNVSIGEVMQRNIEKLRERHGEAWSGGQYESKD